MILPDDITERAITLKDQYFDLRGLSVYSALGVGTLREYIREGALPCFKVKGKILVKQSEFDRWIEAHRMDKNKSIDSIVDEVVRSMNKDESK